MKAMLRLAAALLLAALLASCSAVRLTYNNAAPLVRFSAHEYFDLDDAQNERFRNRLARFHEWHRKVELPQYAALLETAAQKVQSGASRADLEWAVEAMRVRYRVLLTKAIEDAAPILVTLTPQQLAELERRLAKANRKYAEEFVSGGERHTHRARFKRVLQRFEDWTGDLSDDQQARIERFVSEHAQLPAMRLDDRKRVQREGVALMRELRSAQALVPPMVSLLVYPESHRTPEFSAALARWESGLLDLVLDIERTLTQEQRARVVQRMKRYAEDFQVLASEESVVGAAPGP